MERGYTAPLCTPDRIGTPVGQMLLFPSYSVPAGNSASLPVGPPNSSVNQVLSLLSMARPSCGWSLKSLKVSVLMAPVEGS